MTNEEIDALQAGPELDALISVKIMGMPQAQCDFLKCPEVTEFGWDFHPYSTDIKKALKVAKGLGLSTVRTDDDKWLCGKSGKGIGTKGILFHTSIAEHESLAICRSALKVFEDKSFGTTKIGIRIEKLRLRKEVK